MIHKTAIVDKKAEISGKAIIGPYSIVGPNVKIGEGVEIQSHVNITGNTIGTTDNSPITVTTGMNFNGGVSGSPVAFAYFLTSKT